MSKYTFFRHTSRYQPYASLLLRRLDQIIYLFKGQITKWSKSSGHLCHVKSNDKGDVWGVEARTHFNQQMYQLTIYLRAPRYFMWHLKHKRSIIKQRNDAIKHYKHNIEQSLDKTINKKVSPKVINELKDIIKGKPDKNHHTRYKLKDKDGVDLW